MKDLQRGASEELLTRLVHKMGRSLGAFRSTTQALLNGADEDPLLRRELLQDMEQELGELQRLLDNVTQLKALERGTFRLNRRELAPSPWLQQLTARWQHVAKEKGLAWIIDVPENLPVIEGDTDKLEQSVDNLLSNAVLHTPHGARVSFTAGLEGNALVLRITSDQPRLASDAYGRLFELFRTGDEQGRFPVGLGLGLYITRQLIEKHGGKMNVVPPGQGHDAVAFEVSLPVAATAHSDPPGAL